MDLAHRRISSGWSTEERRSSVRSGTRVVMAWRFCFVSRGFRRRRRSLDSGRQLGLAVVSVG